MVDWNWNTGSGPTGALLTTSGSNWSVGSGTYGPGSGNYLATKPTTDYTSSANDWVRLPTIDLSAYPTCKVKVTVNLWVYTEANSGYRFDGGNLQYTVDPTAASGWTLMDGGSMAYDGALNSSGCSSSSCLINGQNAWSTEAGLPKVGTFTSAGALGSALTLRFTFHSDSSVVYPGIYVKSLKVETTP